MVAESINHSRVSLSLQSLIEIRHQIRRNQQSQQAGHYNSPGQHAGAQRGQGMEFIDLRPYNAGDDVRHIDWNVTARYNEAYTRLYRAEREHIATVTVDLRPCMFTGSQCLKSVAAGRMAAAILWQARYSGSRCSAIVISATGIKSTQPTPGNTGVLRGLELIAREFALAAQQIKTPADEPALSTVLKFVAGKPGHYFLVSGLDTTPNDNTWDDQLAAVASNLTTVLLLDPLEVSSLPRGNYRYKSHRQTNQIKLTNKYSDVVTQALQANIQSRMQAFERYAMPLVTTNSNSTTGELLSTLQQRNLI